MILELALQAQVEQSLRKDIEKLRLHLTQLADVRRENEMGIQYSRVIKAREE